MKSTQVLVLTTLILIFNGMMLAAPGEVQRKKLKGKDELARHLALMEDLEKRAENEGWKRPVPPTTLEPLTAKEAGRWEEAARHWASRLWITNAVYRGHVTLANLKNPKWMPFSGIWTNEFMKVIPRVFREAREDNLQPGYVKAEFNIPVSNTTVRCCFVFIDEKAAEVQSIRNYLYFDPNVPYRQDGEPLHTTEAQARKKAEEYAEMFGVSNIWDKTQFMLRSPGFTRGNWNFNLTPNINGYSSLYPVIVSLADLPGLPLAQWVNCLDQIPANLPTNVVLTAAQARAKGEEYLKQYFPLKELIPVLKFHSNYLEYSSPNYNYIRPADDTGFSNYKPKKDNVSLIWKNAFRKPEGAGFPWVLIFVDAATGEMLGGSD